MSAAAPAPAGLRVRGVRVAYGRATVLDGVSLDVAAGETSVLFGPSGAGKTVLLRALAGLEPGATGRVWIGGRDVSALGPEHRRVGVAFQNFALYPHMPASANIASPLRARRLPAEEVQRRVQAVASLLKIGHVLGNLPRALSNGQKQRTALARALVAEPDALLLDDPLRNVDAKLRYEMRMELPRLLRRAGAATIYVTQDHREAMALGDRIAVLVEGRVAQVGTPEEVYDAPATVAVARLFGDPPLNLIPARAEPGGVRALGLHLPLRPARPSPAGAAPPGGAGARPETADPRGDNGSMGRQGAVLLGLRPEAISVLPAPAQGAAPATLVAATPLHERLVLLLRTPDGAELLASTAGDAPAEGSAVWFRPDPARALLYDADSGLRVPATAAQPEMAS